jgi:hypothetical protein
MIPIMVKRPRNELWATSEESRKRAMDDRHHGWDQEPGDGSPPFKSLF